jgi:molybdenum cofactor cytidylyltransferase
MISAIILAAGRSRRMGAQKLLLPIAGQPLVARIVEAVLGSVVERVVVVVGSDAEQVRAALGGHAVRFVMNPNPEGEMLSSVRCGLRALPADTSAVLVVLGDQPYLSANVINRLVTAFHTTARGIVAPTHAGRRGHPLLFAAGYRDEILAHYDQVGLRGLLLAHPEDVAEVEVAAAGILEDIDLPEDYSV